MSRIKFLLKPWLGAYNMFGILAESVTFSDLISPVSLGML